MFRVRPRQVLQLAGALLLVFFLGMAYRNSQAPQAATTSAGQVEPQRLQVVLRPHTQPQTQQPQPPAQLPVQPQPGLPALDTKATTGTSANSGSDKGFGSNAGSGSGLVSDPQLPLQRTGEWGFHPSTTAILIFTRNRAASLRSGLQGLVRSRELALRGRPADARLFFPIFVSVDDADPEVAKVLREMAPHIFRVTHHIRQTYRGPQASWKDKYWGISQHFKDAIPAVMDGAAARMTDLKDYRMTRIEAPQAWAAGDRGPLGTPGSPELAELRFEHLIPIEDDLMIAEDFIEYFWAMGDVLQRDPKLMCISAWNDHGSPEFARDPTVLRRTDFFPGLGWMFGREHWDSWVTAPQSARPGWPDLLWDEWLRHPHRRRGRHCLYPEVSRTSHPVPASQLGSRTSAKSLINSVRLNTAYQPWLARPTEDYLAQLDYQAELRRLTTAVEQALVVASPEELRRQLPQLRARLRPGQGLALHYTTKPGFEQLGRRLGILADVWHGVPRTALQGIVELNWAETPGHPLYLAPPPGQPTTYATCPKNPDICRDGSFWS